MFGKELSETLRERIIGSYLSGIKQCIISEELGVPKNTVNDTIKRYKKTGSAHLKNAQVIQKCLPNAIHELYNVLSEAIVSRVLKDPGKLGAQWFNTFLKNYNLLPSYLRKIGVVFAVEEHDAKILSKAMTIASEALRHSSDNNTSSVQNYIIVNYRPRGVPYDQAIPFKVSDKN
ncbi:2484_t:CDS:2 [Rhizophagus irregularis]|nr:2484_t:CDS:2 [Rhizophagus irregularis]